MSTLTAALKHQHVRRQYVTLYHLASGQLNKAGDKMTISLAQNVVEATLWKFSSCEQHPITAVQKCMC